MGPLWGPWAPMGAHGAPWGPMGRPGHVRFEDLLFWRLTNTAYLRGGIVLKETIAYTDKRKLHRRCSPAAAIGPI